MGEIAPGVHLIDGLGVGPRLSNVYLLVGETLAVVDAGLPGSFHAIRRYINSIGRSLSELKHILITHAHPDHTGGAPALHHCTGAQIVVHASDVKVADSGPSVAYGLFGTLPFKVPFFRKVTADVVLNDGDELPIMGGVKVHHTPGHTPGSVCYELKEMGVLLSGDILLVNGNCLAKNHAFPGSQRVEYQASLEKIAVMDFRWLCPGHGKPLQTSEIHNPRSLSNPTEGYDWTWRLFGG